MSLSIDEFGKNPWNTIGILGLVAAVSLFISILFVGSSYEVADSANWVPTPCTIKKSWVEEHQSYTRRRGGRRKRTTYEPKIEYQYSFQNQTYSSERFEIFGTERKSKSYSDQFVAHFPAGSASTCWVNPHQPSESVIKRNSETMAYVWILPVLICLGSGSAFLFKLNSQVGFFDNEQQPGLDVSFDTPPFEADQQVNHEHQRQI